MADVRRTSYAQQSINGGITIEGDAITKTSVKELERVLDIELKGLKQDMMKQVRKMKGKK